MPIHLLFCVAVISGVVGAITGLGGGVVLVPILTWAGIDIKHAIALNVLSVISVSCGAAPIYIRHHITNLRVSAFLEIFAVLGALLGASIAVAVSPRPLFFVCAALLLVSAWMLWRTRRRPAVLPRPGKISRWLELRGSYYDEAERRTLCYEGRRASLGGMLMVGTGAVAGFLGISGGAFAVLLLELMGLPPKVSSATSNLLIGVMALMGAGVFLEAGLIDPTTAVPVVLGALVGSLVGAKVAGRLTNARIRLFFLVVLIVLGVQMLQRGLRGF